MALRETTTKYGKVKGALCGNPKYTVFRGIPYAAPTSGANRFRAPQPPQPWDGVKECTEFADICMQESAVAGLPFSDFFFKEFYVHQYPCSEDSLRLNVWTPAEKADEKLPVMVWIHGGGFGSGYGHEMEFDGEAICKENVILVTIQYRLTYFGFFAHPDLAKESESGTSGNYGILDQIAALKWVKENIEAFGGDKDNVTIFGQSAGGMSVVSLLQTPLSKGLFERAIIQSGGFGLTSPVMANDIESAEDWGVKFCEYANKTVDELRQMDAHELMALFAEAQKTIGPANKIAYDGYVFTDSPSNDLKNDKWKNITVMVGSVRGDKDLIWQPIPTAVEAGIPHKEQAFIGDAMVSLQYAKEGHSPAYQYFFDPYIPDHDEYGFVEDGNPYHSAEMWYIFGTLSRCWRNFDGRHYDLSQKMTKYWTNFAKTGNPNGEGLDYWPAFTNDCKQELYMTENEITARQVRHIDAIENTYMK